MKTVTLPLDEFDKMRKEIEALNSKNGYVEQALNRIYNTNIDKLITQFSQAQSADDRLKISELVRSGQF